MKSDQNKVYALAGVFGGISVGGAFVFGSVLTTATGIPLMSAIVNGIWVGLVMATCSRYLYEYRWTGTAMMFVYGVAATFTVLLGPPGWHKVPVALAMGLVWDLSLIRSKSVIAYLVASVLFMVVAFGLLVFTFWLQNSPAFDKILPALPYLATTSAVTMCIGSIIGRTVGDRLAILPAAQRVIGKA